MSPNALRRPALGQTAQLGTLYDARSDNFLSMSLLPPSEAALLNRSINTNEVKFSSTDTYQQKFDMMGISSELSASILAELVDVAGSGRYLIKSNDTGLAVQKALRYTITTVHEKLDFASGSMSLDFAKLQGELATHVVAEISWGAESIVAVSDCLPNDEDRSQVDSRIMTAVRDFDASMKVSHPDPERGKERQNGVDSSVRQPQFTVYSDVPGLAGPADPESARRSIFDMPNHLLALNDGKGKPIVYTLLPVGFFSVFFSVDLACEISVGQPSAECQSNFVNLFDDLHKAQVLLRDYYNYLEQHRFCMPEDYVASIFDHIHAASAARSDLESKYAQLLREIRVGSADSKRLSLLFEDCLSGTLAPQKLVALTREHIQKLKFVASVTESGGRYLGYDGPSLESAVARDECREAYAFFFNEKVIDTDASWNENLALLLEVLQRSGGAATVWIVDCEAFGQPLETSYMSRISNGKVTEKDLLEQKKDRADKSFMRYEKACLDRSITTSPSQRRVVRIPCPGSACDSRTICEWLCFECHAPVEYGKVDQFIYCDCGRTPYDRYSFCCKEPHHGPVYARYEKTKLFRLLGIMTPPRELNVLILGETGVGKSTFVNAFVNYLTFDTLDEGMSAEKLNHIIPCSFSTQYVDEANGGKLVQKIVQIGFDADERDGIKGQSATQKTMVYPLYIGGNTLVRLIDTPGIGDTRGSEQDKKNFQDVLSVLRNYEKLHGILILLRPNNSRLTVMFRFCVQELLTHLHRSAANNMVFGFTNTRGSNYQPGDTFGPLETLLGDYRDVIPGLFHDNVYCFDSESFRYLAARKKGIDMGNLDDYRRSWDKSATESQRMLRHFRTLEPHRVKSTLSLNETRALIAQLIQPMAEISKTMNKTIAVNEEDTKALSDVRLTGSDLRAHLQMQVVSLTARQLDKPKTACSNESCVKIHSPSPGSNEEVRILYTTLCHNPCCLTDVPPDSVGTRELERCWAFRQGKSRRLAGCCRVCRHDWTEHLHIVVEYDEHTSTVDDATVQAALDKNSGDVELKETAIKAKTVLIAQLKREHKEIQEATARFSIYLEKNSITPYNDATLEYLDHLIKEERSKVGFGAKRHRLDGLERDRAQYSEFVKAIRLGMKRGNRDCQPLTEEGVYRLVEKLYRLPHSGSDLRRVANVVATAYAATFREKPYRLRGKRHGAASPAFSAAPEPPKGGLSNRISLLISPNHNGKEAPAPPSKSRLANSSSSSSSPPLEHDPPTSPPPYEEASPMEIQPSATTMVSVGGSQRGVDDVPSDASSWRRKSQRNSVVGGFLDKLKRRL